MCAGAFNRASKEGRSQYLCHELVHVLQYQPCNSDGIPTDKDILCTTDFKTELQAYYCAGQCPKIDTPAGLRACYDLAWSSAQSTKGCIGKKINELIENSDVTKWFKDNLGKKDFCPVQYHPPSS